MNRTRVVSCRLPANTALRFAALARQVSLRTPARLLAHLVNQALSQSGEPVASPAPAPAATQRIPGPTRRVTTTLKQPDAQKLTVLADDFGGVSAWLRGRIEVALGRSTELPAHAEVEALHHATTELWAVGNNLNQVARALNEARVAGKALPVEKVAPTTIESLAERVDALAEQNVKLIAAARRRGFQRG